MCIKTGLFQLKGATLNNCESVDTEIVSMKGFTPILCNLCVEKLTQNKSLSKIRSEMAEVMQLSAWVTEFIMRFRLPLFQRQRVS